MASTHDITAPLSRKAAAHKVVRQSGRLTASLSADASEVSTLWQRLEAQPAVTFHQSRIWANAWSKVTGAQLILVTLEHDGVPIALLPLEIRRKGGLNIAQFAGTAFSNENTGLVDLGSVDAIGKVSNAELAIALNQAGLDADIVIFDKMPPEAAARPPFSALPRVFHQNPSFQLPLFKDFSAVLAQINGKRRRKKYRVSERRLEAIGGYRHIIGENDAKALRLLDTFLAQKRVRLAAQGLPNVFGDPGVQAFLADLAVTRHPDGRPALELHGIEMSGGEHEGKIIAVAGLTAKDHHVTCQFGSIDEEIGTEASAGELLFFRMIERAALAGNAVFDFGVGDQLYKRSWCPQRTELVDCYATLNLKGRIAAPLITGVIRLKRTIKTSPTLHKMAAWLRGLLVRRSVATAEND